MGPNPLFSGLSSSNHCPRSRVRRTDIILQPSAMISSQLRCYGVPFTLRMQAYNAPEKPVMDVLFYLRRHYDVIWRGMTSNFNTTSTIHSDVVVCQVSRFYSFALSRYCAEENEGINMPLSDRLVARRPSSRHVDMVIMVT